VRAPTQGTPPKRPERARRLCGYEHLC
jgi:hypothetical protein